MKYIRLNIIFIVSLLCISGCIHHNKDADNIQCTIRINADEITIADDDLILLSDFKYIGFFLKTDRDDFFIADGDSLMFHDKEFVRIYPARNPSAEKVTFDQLNNGDKVGIEIITVGALNPRVMDIYRIKLIEEGDISNIDESVITALNELGYHIKYNERS